MVAPPFPAKKIPIQNKGPTGDCLQRVGVHEVSMPEIRHASLARITRIVSSPQQSDMKTYSRRVLSGKLE